MRFLRNYIPPQGGWYVAGCWGWTDTTTNREYAILGCFAGTSIVEITDAYNPVERDFIPGPNSDWRELQTYSHYAYVVTEGGGGVQIIDLSFLPDSVRLVKRFNFSQGSKNISASHTNHIKDGILYLNGCAYWPSGGAVMFSLADPVNPSFVGSYDTRYFHDSFARNDTLFGACLGEGIDIVDVSNKSNPTLITRIPYSGSGTHNCATTEDGRYLLTTDEIGSTPKTLKIWDLQHLPSVTKVAEYQGDPSAIIHNVFVKGTIAFMSYYTDGLRIVDISDPTTPVEVGGYDTYPWPGNGFTGAWSTYPFFPSGKIIIGDMNSGLYIVELNANAPRPPATFRAYSDFNTPSTVFLNWKDPSSLISGFPLPQFKIHIYRDGQFIATVDSGVEKYVDTYLTYHQGYTYSLRTVIATDSSSFTTDTVYSGGHAQPRTPTNFQIQNFDNGTKLSWVTPSTQLDNTPLNDLASIAVYRDNVLVENIIIADTAVYQEYYDSTIGFHTYAVAAVDNETPEHSSEFTQSHFGFGGSMQSSFHEQFDSGQHTIYSTGYWGTTQHVSASGNTSITDSPTGNSSANTKSYILLPPVKAGPGFVLSFNQIA
ncbi:MAG: choice-of-anchor B family protein, partial [Ignavibacteriae bacterium]|nr:choice-of-anchor B family protein [Ignavibacteriota bacterium]